MIQLNFPTSQGQVNFNGSTKHTKSLAMNQKRKSTRGKFLSIKLPEFTFNQSSEQLAKTNLNKVKKQKQNKTEQATNNSKTLQQFSFQISTNKISFLEQRIKTRSIYNSQLLNRSGKIKSLKKKDQTLNLNSENQSFLKQTSFDDLMKSKSGLQWGKKAQSHVQSPKLQQQKSTTTSLAWGQSISIGQSSSYTDKCKMRLCCMQVGRKIEPNLTIFIKILSYIDESEQKESCVLGRSQRIDSVYLSELQDQVFYSERDGILKIYKRKKQIEDAKKTPRKVRGNKKRNPFSRRDHLTGQILKQSISKGLKSQISNQKELQGDAANKLNLFSKLLRNENTDLK